MKMSAEIPNKELAEYYLRAMTPYSAYQYVILNYKRISRTIAQAEVNISSFHSQNNGLKDLKVPGLGQKTLRSLELILERGVDEAIRITVERRSSEMASRPFTRARDFRGHPV